MSGRVMTSRELAHWGPLALDEQYQAPGECGSAHGQAEHVVIVQLQDMPRCQQQWAGRLQDHAQLHGTFSIIPAYMTHHWRWFGNAHDLHLSFAPSFFAELAQRTWTFDAARVELRDDCYDFRDPFLWRLVSALRMEVFLTNIHGSLYVSELSDHVATHLLRYHSTLAEQVKRRLSPHVGQLSFAQLRTVVEYIETHLTESLSLDTLAATVGVDRYWFSKQFHRSTGMPPYQYVIFQRIERAKRLLMHSTHTPAEVAQLVGFADQAHLTRLFRRYVGITPGAFTKSHRYFP
ncbi:AraC family transcriptional regulator [Dictyobacter alpinus]|uniref:AraC family transcriptional regulator n=1 Tax=Dictyobacter alpinus TaxID=2014873 RepID=A0A402BFA0_9CHLR|nr:AraC family transcriptional regulator [Dictyobacter alpinus]